MQIFFGWWWGNIFRGRRAAGAERKYFSSMDEPKVYNLLSFLLFCPMPDHDQDY